ncbi:Aerotaxis receptor [Leclercia adecarboxylata]|nr:Aerotaxis receptor [Leclercia adecarboxylata]
MEQLAASVQQNAANMEQTQQLVGETSRAVHQGGETVSNAVSTMDDIREASKRIEAITPGDWRVSLSRPIFWR